VACEFTFGLEPILQITVRSRPDHGRVLHRLRDKFRMRDAWFPPHVPGALPNVLLARPLWKVVWTAYLSSASMTYLSP
jgi:hypothetical protein